MPPRQAKVQRSPLELYKEHKERWKGGCGAEECSRARKIVFARGTIPARILFIGEGPGISEDVLGKPFIGPAGELLQRIIDDSIPPEVTYVLYNMVGCMPTDDDGDKSGTPTDEQVTACAPKLQEFVKIANPDLIVCVGATAEDWTDPKLHHHIDFHRPIKRIAIKHPAAVLRSNIATRGLEVQRCIVQISTAVQELLDGDSENGSRRTSSV